MKNNKFSFVADEHESGSKDSDVTIIGKSKTSTTPKRGKSSSEHNAKLDKKREEKKKQTKGDSPLEKREVIMNGAKLKCPYAQAPGELKVTSNEINLQDQLWATEGDGNNMINLQFKGTCGHTNFAGQTPPPCMSVIKLSPWQNLGTSFVQEQKVLVKESFITCDPAPNVAVPKPIPKVESIAKREDKKDDKVKREIYLTFDDGIQAGTEEVLELLKEKGIKGTFFLTGIHLYYFIEKSKDRKKALNVLKDIYENHAIGNHSYSHVNDFYKNAYKEGIKYKGDGSKPEDKRSVFTDFVKCKEQILGYLDEIYGKGVIKNRAVPLAKNQAIPLARFPGRNTWYTNEFVDIDTDNSKDTKDEAKELYEKRGYQVYGWDCEWNIKSWDFKDASVKTIQKKVDNKTMDFGKDEEAHPYYDMYSKQNIGFDRVSESWIQVRDELLDYIYNNPYTPTDHVSKKEGKVILLMHERSFRNGKLLNGKVDLSNKDEINKLRELIDYFVKIKAEFKTLEEY